MSFYEVRIHLGFPADLLIDTNLSGALWWLKQLEEHVGDEQDVGFWKYIDVPGNDLIEIVAATKGEIHHRNVEPERIITPEQASRLFRRESMYRVELFET